MVEELLKVLANRTNQDILNLLTVEPTYPRKIADLLSLAETEVARRLRQMEKLDLVSSQWSYIGKNVKLYQLVADRVEVTIAAEGIRVDLHERGSGRVVHAGVQRLVMHLPEPEEFVGRAVELEGLKGDRPVAIVEGMPGIGKTSLLATFARSRGADPVFWHSFRGVESLNWLANRLGLFLAQNGHTQLLEAVEQGADAADKRALLLEALDLTSVTVVLDDVHKIEDPVVKDFLTDAIHHVRHGRLVVGARERPAHNPSAGHVRLLELRGLDDDAVGEFLQRKELPLPEHLLPRLRSEVGGHPLALNLFVEAVKAAGGDAEAMLDGVPERDLEEYLLREIYGHLEDDERRVLGLASLFRGSFTHADVLAMSSRNPQGVLLRLRRRLLVQALDHEYALHEIIRNFFYSLLHDKARLHSKLADHYLGKGTLEGRLEAMHHMLAADQRDRVLKLLEENLDLREFDLIDAGYQNLYMDTLDLFDEAKVASARTWGLIQDEKADIWFHRADYPRAMDLYEAAEALFAQVGDDGRVADVAWKRAMCLGRLGRPDAALELCQATLSEGAPDDTARRRLEELSGALRQG